MDDEAEISSGTDTDEDGALIEKARQAAEQKRAAPRKRGPTSRPLQPCTEPVLHTVCEAQSSFTQECGRVKAGRTTQKGTHKYVFTFPSKACSV